MSPHFAAIAGGGTPAQHSVALDQANKSTYGSPTASGRCSQRSGPEPQTWATGSRRPGRAAFQQDRRVLDGRGDEVLSAVAAIVNTARARRPAGTVVPGSRAQFRVPPVRRVTAAPRLTGSMGWDGACADKAAMQSCFSLPQKNVLDRQRWLTRQRTSDWASQLGSSGLSPPATTKTPGQTHAHRI